MQSDTIAFFLFLAAAVLIYVAVLIWLNCDPAKTKSASDSEESTVDDSLVCQPEKTTKPKNGGSRVGACIALAVLALVAQIACGFVYTLLFTLSSLLTFLPDFLVYVLAFAFYPLVLGILFVPLMHFLPWAADCSERICPTRKGLRYVCIVIYDVLCVISNVLPCILGRTSFSFYYLLPLIYAFVFLNIKSSLR